VLKLVPNLIGTYPSYGIKYWMKSTSIMKFSARHHHFSPCFLKSIEKEKIRKKTKYKFLPSLFFISRTLKILVMEWNSWKNARYSCLSRQEVKKIKPLLV
jgi:hypothetical protein